MKRVAYVFVIVALGLLMLSELAWRRKKAEKEIREHLRSSERFVDMGVVLKTVVADPTGSELVEGMPLLRVVREKTFGGIVDTKALKPHFIGPSRHPVIWYCSEDQERILLHNDLRKLGVLVYGSEGSGKTRTLAMWHGLRVLEHLGENREGGQTAPTDQRLEFIRVEFASLFPKSWCRHFVAADMYVFCDGSRIQLVSTHKQSAAQGSPIQGFNWSWCGRDEGQDQVAVHADIEARGRRARGGGKFYKQLITATAKDDSNWKTLRDVLLGSGKWIKVTLSIFRSPFVDKDFINDKAASISAREFRRRFGDPITGDVDDLPPELAVYHAWLRGSLLHGKPDGNLIRIPALDELMAAGWEDVTEIELSRWGRNFKLHSGHDPGSLFDVTELLKAYRVPWANRPIWIVVDEVTTEQTTTEAHVKELLRRVRTAWRTNLLRSDGRPSQHSPKLFCRADPYGNNDSKPDRSCYTIFRNNGITIHPAAYNADGDGPGRVPKEAGIDVVNTLFCNARGERYLFVAVDHQNRPVAPHLVEAIEQSERDHDGKAETQRKDKHDLSHWTAALRYALWVIERPRLQIGARAA